MKKGREHQQILQHALLNVAHTLAPETKHLNKSRTIGKSNGVKRSVKSKKMMGIKMI
jgi:hypothetical protein